MRVTLAYYLRMAPKDRAYVTHIFLDNKFEDRLERGLRGDSEEYEGEGRDRGTDQRGFNR